MIDAEGRQVAESILGERGYAMFQHHDVSDEGSWEAVVAKAIPSSAASTCS